MHRFLKVSFSNNSDYREFSIKRFEELFQISYLPHLVFADWSVEQWIRKKCKKAYNEGHIGQLARWLGKLHAQEIESAKIPDVAIRWIDPEIGYGLFANRTFKKWEYIGEYTGILRRRNLFFPNVNDYCFMYPREWISTKAFTIDSAMHGNYTRFINHSDTPNLESISVLHDGIFHIIFRTIQDIPNGTELKYDYGDIYWYRRKKKQEIVDVD